MIRAAIPLSISAALVLVLALALSSGKPVPTGAFRGERPVAARPGADPVVVAQLSRVELSIDADGRAVLQKGGVPFEGHVTRSGDTLTFEVLSVANVNIAKQDPSLPRSLTFDLLPDGSLRHEGIVLQRRT